VPRWARRTVIRVGIADDVTSARQELLDHLARFSTESGTEFDVQTFASGESLLAAYRSNFDILFLDVEMADLDGFDTARRVRELDNEVVIVFVTNMSQFAIKGYEVNALSYLLKPVPYFAFAQELARCVERIQRRSSPDLVVTADNAIIRLNLDEIIYIESAKHRITVHTFTRPYSYSGTLRAVEKEVESGGFFRSNNYYLVNLRYVKRVEQNTSVMVGGQELAISRARKKPFLEALADHLGGRRP
jgi:DNA-binding LytR/AlgR family response regulator